MQALSVYLLVRLNEGENEDNNVDTLVLTTLAVRRSISWTHPHLFPLANPMSDCTGHYSTSDQHRVELRCRVRQLPLRRQDGLERLGIRGVAAAIVRTFPNSGHDCPPRPHDAV